jgi:hypothetical protein
MSPIGQEFVPSLTPLIGVDVWLKGTAYVINWVTVNIRESTITGTILASTSKSISSPFDGWVHFDLPIQVPVIIGSTYVLQLVETENIFFWEADYGGTYAPGDGIMAPPPGCSGLCLQNLRLRKRFCWWRSLYSKQVSHIIALPCID